jgi:hypothetical protein
MQCKTKTIHDEEDRRSTGVKIRSFWVLFLWPGLIMAQSGLDLTGRVSLRVQNTGYDEDSELLPDSISAADYGKTTLIPGLQEMLNISLFGRTRNLDLTFLADLKNNDWNTLELTNFNSIPRLTLDLRWANQELIAGDFFDSYSDLFILSREVRGGKYQVQLADLWGNESFLEVKALGGIVQREIDEGDRSNGMYKQFETAGQYRRWMGAGVIKAGMKKYFDVTLNYLYGKDQESSIDTSLNIPLKNNVYGGATNLYFWERNLRLFGEFYQSTKDSLNLSSVSDEAYYSGLDFRYRTFNLVFYFENLGGDYFTVGYPYLENDKRGAKSLLDYAFPEIIMLTTDFEFYKDNLVKEIYRPTASTSILNVGLTTLLPHWPELTIRYGLRTDLSDTLYDQENQPLKTEKTSIKIEGRLGFNFDRNRLAISAIKLDLDDESLIGSVQPLSTRQFITSMNFYSTAVRNLFLTTGAVYSDLQLSNGQTNFNLYVYETTRWDIVPRRLQFESTVTYIQNNASSGGIQDVLNDYFALLGEVSLEYFISTRLSFKLIVGTDTKKYQYNTDDALNIIANPEYGPVYFNGFESYKGLIAGGEINWIF